jgi:hypothetical protein
MTKITIIIPTRNRFPELLRLLASISSLKWIEIIVGIDGDLDTLMSLTDLMRIGKSFRTPDLVIYSPIHIGSMALSNRLSSLVTDGVIPTCDDMEFLPGIIEGALDIFNQNFPDDDGVLGLHQEGLPSYCPTGICLMGQRFLSRYPNKWLFCPEYYHFGDVEIYHLAAKLGRFQAGGKEIAVLHHQAGYEGRPLDQTHHDARVKQREDSELRIKREQEGKIWGDDPNKVKGIKRPPSDRMIREENTVIR